MITGSSQYRLNNTFTVFLLISEKRGPPPHPFLANKQEFAERENPMSGISSVGSLGASRAPSWLQMPP